MAALAFLDSHPDQRVHVDSAEAYRNEAVFGTHLFEDTRRFFSSPKYFFFFIKSGVVVVVPFLPEGDGTRRILSGDRHGAPGSQHVQGRAQSPVFQRLLSLKRRTCELDDGERFLNCHATRRDQKAQRV